MQAGLRTTAKGVRSLSAGREKQESGTGPWWASIFGGSEEEPEGSAVGLIKRSHKGRRDTKRVFQRSSKDRGSREQSAESSTARRASKIRTANC